MDGHTYESLCQQILERAADGIIFADRDGVIRLWNFGAQSIFGYCSEEALGHSLDLIVPEKFRERHWQGYHQVMATGVSRYGKEILAVPATTKEGNRISIEFTVALLTDSSGEPLGAAAIVRNVTERRQKEQELKKRLAALEQQRPKP